MRVAFFVFSLAVAAAIEPKVTAVSPNIGSTKGGTRLTITGVGFSTNYHETGGNYVVIGEDAVCESIWFLSSNTRIVCDTAARAAGSFLAIKIAVDGKSWVRTTADAATGFQYKTGYAGTLKSVHPISGKAGSVISLKGQGWDQNLGEIRYLAVATAACDQEKLNYFRPTYLAEPDSWAHDAALTTMYGSGHIRCRLSAHTAGSYPISMTTSKGNISKATETSRLSNGGRAHEFQIYGDVQSVSPSLGGLNGGTRLTITGQGFSDLLSDNIVIVGEHPCAVITSTPTKITCETSARKSFTNRSFYAGGRGLKQFKYDNLAPSGSMAWHLWAEDISYPSSFQSLPGRVDGFTGEFLRATSKDEGLSAVLDLGANTLKIGRSYGISFMYRSDAGVRVGKATDVAANKLDALTYTGTFEARVPDPTGSITFCGHTSYANHADSKSGVKVRLEFRSGWSSEQQLFTSASKGGKYCTTFTTSFWPTAAQLTIGGTDAWGFWKLTLDGVQSTTLIMDSAGSAGSAYGDTGFWIDGNQEAPSTVTYDVPSALISPRVHFISTTATWLEVSQIIVWDPSRITDSDDSSAETEHVLIDSRLEFSSANLLSFKKRALTDRDSLPRNRTSVQADGLSVMALDEFKDNGAGHFSRTVDGTHTGVHQVSGFVPSAVLVCRSIQWFPVQYSSADPYNGSQCSTRLQIHTIADYCLVALYTIADCYLVALCT
jgi:hypothetical protein